MYVSPVEYVLAGYWILYAVSAAVSSMSPPSKLDGCYAFWYRFLRQMTNATNAAFEKKFHMDLPIVTEQTSSLQITHPDGSVKTKADSLVTSTPVVTVVPTDFIK